jgi:thiamine-phosphate pyrophosphorylase
MKINVDYKLYLVTDREVLKSKNLTSAIEEGIRGGVTLVQLREKDLTSLEFYNTAIKVKEITDKYNIPLIVNDRLDIALAIDAAGLHVGQEDMPAPVARRLLGPEKILGVSAATMEEAEKAEKDGADYIGVGAIFPTSTKDDARSVSVELLKEIKARVSIPVVAIGGINSKNVKLINTTNIDGIAVVSDILGKEDIKIAAEELKKQID